MMGDRQREKGKADLNWTSFDATMGKAPPAKGWETRFSWWLAVKVGILVLAVLQWNSFKKKPERPAIPQVVFEDIDLQKLEFKSLERIKAAEAATFMRTAPDPQPATWGGFEPPWSL